MLSSMMTHSRMPAPVREGTRGLGLGLATLLLACALLFAAANGAAAAVFGSQAQAHAALSAVLAKYEQIAAAGGWPSIPPGPRVDQGMKDPRIPLVRQHLLITGDLPMSQGAALPGAADVLDKALAQALRLYQSRHGLGVHGALDDKTAAAMSVPVAVRVAVLRLNLKRLARMPDMGERYLLVNVPAKELFVIEGGRVTFVNRVSVGRPDRQTPELKSAVSRIELNPYWTVPSRIATVDLLPMIKADPNFFASYHVRVFSGEGEVDPARVNWGKLSSMPYRLRQEPGEANALGRIKFVFANNYSVYLHGTPVQEQFQINGRFLTSGCIRAEDPVRLAAHILRQDQPEWSLEAMLLAIDGGKNTPINLARPMPIYLAYLTAWADEQGMVHFAEDIYGRDRDGGKLVSQLEPDLQVAE
jgi:murein L,D-transpeptidase YcbB/YkuD